MRLSRRRQGRRDPRKNTRSRPCLQAQYGRSAGVSVQPGLLLLQRTRARRQGGGNQVERRAPPVPRLGPAKGRCFARGSPGWRGGRHAATPSRGGSRPYGLSLPYLRTLFCQKHFFKPVTCRDIRGQIPETGNPDRPPPVALTPTLSRVERAVPPPAGRGKGGGKPLGMLRAPPPINGSRALKSRDDAGTPADLDFCVHGSILPVETVPCVRFGPFWAVFPGSCLAYSLGGQCHPLSGAAVRSGLTAVRLSCGATGAWVRTRSRVLATPMMRSTR